MTRVDAGADRSGSLAGLLDLNLDRPLWEPQELGAILQHQLSAPLEFDLNLLGAQSRSALTLLPSQPGPPIHSFRDLFQHPHPPLELLELSRQFAKSSRSRPDSPLPDEIATLLYLLSIVVALLRWQRWITKLDNQALRHSVDWALAQPWLDEATRALIKAGATRLEGFAQAAAGDPE